MIAPFEGRRRILVLSEYSWSLGHTTSATGRGMLRPQKTVVNVGSRTSDYPLDLAAYNEQLRYNAMRRFIPGNRGLGSRSRSIVDGVLGLGIPVGCHAW